MSQTRPGTSKRPPQGAELSSTPADQPRPAAAKLTAPERDRAAGVLLGMAAGDALGAPYEFGPPMGPQITVEMKGGGPWEPGEWTDDTSMAVAIAEVAATGADLLETAQTDRIVTRWEHWSRTAKDVGIQTRQVLRQLNPDAPTTSALAAAQAVHQLTGRSGGNGSLMRTAPVALAYLHHDDETLTAAATRISELTHHDPEASEACVLWSHAIRHAVRTGELDLRTALHSLPQSRQAAWTERIDQAERSTPADFARNGWAVQALQGAWCAITTTPIPADSPANGTYRADHLRLALENAVRGGRDADTVAAIAGSLLGAAYGASAIPWHWRRILHGWPGLTGRELITLADQIIDNGDPTPFDHTYAAHPQVGVLGQHPYDNGIWLGGVAGLRELPPDVTAVVSLCRVQLRPDVPVHIESRLIDSTNDNHHLSFALADAAAAVTALRAEGHVVYLHCVAAQSRTPAVAALCGTKLRGRASAKTALEDLRAVLPAAAPNSAFLAALSFATTSPSDHADDRTARPCR